MARALFRPDVEAFAFNTVKGSTHDNPLIHKGKSCVLRVLKVFARGRMSLSCFRAIQHHTSPLEHSRARRRTFNTLNTFNSEGVTRTYGVEGVLRMLKRFIHATPEA